MTNTARHALRLCAGAALALLAVTLTAPDAMARVRKAPRCQIMTDAVAQTLFEEWNNALQVKPPDPNRVVLTYTADAVLLPTFESGPLIGRDKMRGYFVHFLEQHPVGRIDSRAIIPAGCNMGVVAGLYTFTVDDGGRRVDKPARYTFVYVYKQEGRRTRWLIAHQHSSARP